MITLLTTGSRGDTEPYLALGLALKRAGQQVRIAAFENYADYIRQYDLEFYPIRGDVSRVAASLSTDETMQADNPLKVALSFNKLKRLVFALQKDFADACRGAEAIVYHPGAALGYFLAQRSGIPSVLATPFPMTPTRAYPALIFYDQIRLGKEFNRISHRLFEQIMWSASRAAVRQFWNEEFGKPPANFGNPFRRQISQRYPTIIACSNYVFARPPDWPEHVHNTGYWFLDEAPGWQPPDDLVDFLQSGPAPVYVGFGSMGNPAAAEQTTRLVIEALQSAGQRGVLATGWSGMVKADITPTGIYMLESAPHAWLFPRMAAVVHHGGAGTTAAGLRAGAPAVIVPTSNDQFAWGRRLEELGAGAKPIPRKKLSAENLAEAIQCTLRGEMQATTKDLGRKIQSEHGAERAAEIILEAISGIRS